MLTFNRLDKHYRIIYLRSHHSVTFISSVKHQKGKLLKNILEDCFCQATN